tara:strand:- start:171 stop:380 length:210 start_codon:yes stop_codon:yes gene_type:complete
MNRYINFLKLRTGRFKKEPESIYVEEEDNITDEIEKSLLEIKDCFDLPTEEIEMSIKSRRHFRNINKSK